MARNLCCGFNSACPHPISVSIYTNTYMYKGVALTGEALISFCVYKGKHSVNSICAHKT